MNKIPLMIIAALICVSSFAQSTNKISKIGFSVHYKNGWTAHTDFSADLSVRGAHISGGDEVFVHMVDDTASKELWDNLYAAASEIISLKPIDLNPDPDPVYSINIILSDGTHIQFERKLDMDYGDAHLNKLSKLISKNERIYSHQKGKPWITKTTAIQQVDPTVKTPVESGKAQGTAGHP